MRGRAGFSLVEMVIVLVLAGIVSTAAINMFSTQNRLNAAMTALGESQESARSAVQLTSTELRAASGGTLVVARGNQLVVNTPVVIGIICGVQNSNQKAVYFPLDDASIDLQSDVDGYEVRSQNGVWVGPFRVNRSDGFRNGSRNLCVAAGSGAAGHDGNYATLRVGGQLGDAVMLYREITYSFGPSGLDRSRRAFLRTEAGEQLELAQGFSTNTRFEYRLTSGQWRSSVSSADLRHVEVIRMIAEVVGQGSSGATTGEASYSLIREISLRDAH